MELIPVQEDIWKQLQNAKTNFKKSPKDRITKSAIGNRIESIQGKWKEFGKNHSNILKCKEAKQDNYIVKDVYTEVEEFYLDLLSELKDLLDKINGSTEKPGLCSSSETKFSKTSIRLPKITIPTFSGRYIEWITFRDLFLSLIHNNDNIDSVQKLHYLKGHLTGEAEQLLRHIPITTENYTQCWELLKKRFNNKQFLANNIFARFFSQRNITTESATNLKQLLDNTTDMLQGLKSLEIETTSWDAIIIYIVSQKFDIETRKQWEAKVSEITFNNNVLPNFSQFQNFLQNRFHSLEFLDTKVKDKQIVKPPFSNNFHMSQVTCSYCKGDHKISSCKDFSKLDNNTKRTFVKDNSLCYNCLANNHSVKNCRNPSSCQICKRRHHSLLHSNSAPPHLPLEPVASHQVSEEITTGSAYISKGLTQVSLLPTAIVYIHSKRGVIPLRALIDQGSHISFITQSAVQLLGLRGTTVVGNFSGLGSEIKVVSKSKTNVILHSLHNPDCVIHVTAYILDKLTGLLPPREILLEPWSVLGNIKLADPDYHLPNKIDMLLGSDVYGNILRDGFHKCSAGSLLAQETIFGWILSGTNKERYYSANIVSMHVQMDDMLKAFWEMENEPQLNGKLTSPEAQRCEDIYTSTTTRDDSGRYVVRLPFRDEKPACLGQSRDLATKRFLSLERKLAQNKQLKYEFQKTFDEYLELNHMRPVNRKDNKERVYLPYHAVIKEDKTTTKVRVVFDASCKGKNGVSLNDNLMVGPTLQPELRHIIMRWRKYRICLSADITKMYRQICVNEDDADFQRILWRGSSEKVIAEYKLLRVTFGISSAPYLAVRTLIQLADDEGRNYPLVAERVKRDFYMDDFMSGCDNENEAIQICDQLTDLLNKGGFELQKWKSNSNAVMDKIQKDNKEIKGTEEGKILEEKTESNNKILGLTWNRIEDRFEYAVKLPAIKIPVTKRKVLSDISRLYDPLGWLAPGIVRAKIFIQKLWLSGLSWDEELPPKLLDEWVTYREGLNDLTNFRLNRWMACQSNDRLELHGYCDASNAAYGAVVYLRVKNIEGDIEVSLVTAKTKVAPIKQVSIPRLELCGAVLLAKLLVEVGTVLEIPKAHWHAWTDSEVVLAWLSSPPCKWKTFIGNRITTIVSHLDRSQWSYVKSECNPADAASRGIKPCDIRTHQLWLNGPKWLKDREILYENPKHLQTNLEEKVNSIYFTKVEEKDMWSKFSSLTKLLRVVAYCRRFLKKEKCKLPKHTYLQKEEIYEALDIMIKRSQETYFQQEIDDISQGKNIKINSKLTSLSPYLESGILRVGGRIQLAQVDENRKHPIIIARESQLAKLLVADAHFKTLHGGPQLMLNYIRSKYWILGVKNLVKFQYRKCVTCARYRVQQKNQLMGQLPAERISATRAFLFSGVDYAGPLNIRISKGRGNKSYKGYICLFICMSTRAIHLEAVSDLSAQGFLSAFKRFVARRGHCSNLYSDNGSNFVGAARELKVLFNEEKSSFRQEISDWLANNGTQWYFIPPLTPNFGGLWEAGVKSTKHHLRRVVGNSTLTFEEMTTVLAQIEACLNSRPISYIEDQEDTTPLTPGHFLVGEPLILPPERSYEQVTLSSLRRWQLCQRMVQHFWKRWSQEYLSGLMHRHKWNRLIPEPNIGDVVLVREPDLPPARWLMGRIVDKHPGVDNVTRVVTLRYKNAFIKRPISKICVLPLSDA